MSALPATVGDPEHLARYVLTESWLYKDGRPGCPIRPTAFMPPGDLELSVYRIDGWNHLEVVDQGREVAEDRERGYRERQVSDGKTYPADKRTFRYIGHGQLIAKEVRATGLNAVADEPPIRHANIVSWPPLTGDKKADEAAHLAFAFKLQAKALFIPA